MINNKTDGKTATAMNMSAFRITKTDVTFEIDKYNTMVILWENQALTILQRYMESTAINPAKTRLLKSKSAAMEKAP